MSVSYDCVPISTLPQSLGRLLYKDGWLVVTGLDETAGKQAVEAVYETLIWKWMESDRSFPDLIRYIILVVKKFV